MQQLSYSAKGKMKVSYHSGTGKVRYIGVPLSDAIPQKPETPANITPEKAARNFLSDYGLLFGISDEGSQVRLKRSKDLPDGRSVVKFHQVHKGVPVIAGEIVVNMDSKKGIISVNGETSPDIMIDTIPLISARQAKTQALGMVSKKYSASQTEMEVSPPELSVYNPVLIGEQINSSFLAWKIIVTSRSHPIREFVLIDAKSGIALISFNQVDSIKYREIYDNQNISYYGLPGYGPVRTEGDPPYSIADVNYAYDYLGDTYDFYLAYHGRDSIDDEGMPLIATVRYCDPLLPSQYCPYKNAFWNGSQMVFGKGFAAADDAVGHELTHGVTDHESGLFYYMQSGAINESLSDIWGEFMDQTNGKGTDTDAVKWKMGEDLPIGIIRNMKNPTAFGDPDSMLSPYYYCKGGDNGGVHFNSGVNNKAAYLMTDGGAFNGYTINGLGISTVAKIYYEVQTNLLISGSDYQDLADALNQACQNLIGSVTTDSDCDEVFKTVNAVQMYSMPSCKNIEVPLCNNGTATDVWVDDLEKTDSGNWTPTGYWYYPQNPNPYIDATYTKSGQYNIWGYDYGETYPYYNLPADYYIEMTSSVSLPAGAFMSFNHAYDFERGGFIDSYGNYLGPYYFDGGVLEYSINGGAWYDAKDLIIVNGYNHKIFSQYGNPLGSRKGFTGSSHGYISSKLDLSSLAGQNIRFRFGIGVDSSVGSLGWFIDDVRIYTCSNPDPSELVLTYPIGGETFRPNDAMDITWSGPSDMAYVALKYSLDNGLTWNNIAANITGTSFKWLVPLQNNNKRKCFIKVVGYDSDGVKIGSVQSGLFGIEVVKVTRPNGGESFVSGDPLDPPITWSTNDTKEPVAKVKLYLTKNGGTTWEPIGKTPGNPGSYDWTPQVEKQKIACKVKIELLDALGNILGTDVSDNPFTIQLP